MSAAVAATALAPQGNAGNVAKTVVFLAIAAIVVVVLIIVIKQGSHFLDGITSGWDKLLETLHLKDSAEKEKANADLSEADKIANAPNSPFNPAFYKTAPSSTMLMVASKRKALADQVYSSVGIFVDDPESAFGAFKLCKSWAQVSQLSEQFNLTYGKDAYDWLKIKFDTTKQKDTLAKIVNYCFALPKYTS